MKNQNNNGCGCHNHPAPATGQAADINMTVCDKNANILPMLQTYTTKVLKPNISSCCRKNILTQQMMSCEGYKYVIKWDFDLNGQTITVPKNCILEFDGGSLKNGTIIGQDTLFINVGDVEIWGENLTREGTWKEKQNGGGIPDKDYDPEHNSGLGRKTLELKSEDNTLTQDDFDKENTVYIISYDFSLNGQTVEIPDGCVLDFDGGSLSDGTLDLNGCQVNGTKWIDEDLVVTGTDTIRTSWIKGDAVSYINANQLYSTIIVDNTVPVSEGMVFVNRENLKIIGDNGRIVVEDPDSFPEGDYVIKATACDKLIISNILFDGSCPFRFDTDAANDNTPYSKNNNFVYGIWLGNSNEVTIKDIKMSHFRGVEQYGPVENPLKCQGAIHTEFCSFVTIDGCIFNENNCSCVMPYGGINMSVNNCIFTDINGSAVSGGCDKLIILGNTVEGTQYSALSVNDGSSVVGYNKVKRVIYAGINVSHSSLPNKDSVIVGNVVTDCNLGCVYSDSNAGTLIIKENVFTQTADAPAILDPDRLRGIHLINNSGHIKIEQNIIYQNRQTDCIRIENGYWDPDNNWAWTPSGKGNGNEKSIAIKGNTLHYNNYVALQIANTISASVVPEVSENIFIDDTPTNTGHPAMNVNTDMKCNGNTFSNVCEVIHFRTAGCKFEFKNNIIDKRNPTDIYVLNANDIYTEIYSVGNVSTGKGIWDNQERQLNQEYGSSVNYPTYKPNVGIPYYNTSVIPDTDPERIVGLTFWAGTHWVSQDGTKYFDIIYKLDDLSTNGPRVAASAAQPAFALQILTRTPSVAIPPSIEVKMGNTVLTANVDYIYDPTNGYTKILGIGGSGGVTDTVVVTAAGV